MSKSIVVAVAFLFAVAMPPAASATPQEDAYTAARDKYLKHFEAGDPAKDAVQKDMDRAIADLKVKLEAIIGPVTVKGIDPKPRNNIDTLSSGDDTFGHLDGLAYGPLGNQRMVMVSTDGLLKNWLKLHERWWGKGEPKMPQQPVGGAQDRRFLYPGDRLRFGVSVLRRAADRKARLGELCGVLSLHHRPGFRPVEAQRDSRLGDAGWQALHRQHAGEDPGAAIAACDAIWKAAEKKSEGKDDFDDIRKQGDADFHRCFAERARTMPFFAKLSAEAQTLVDTLPLK